MVHPLPVSTFLALRAAVALLVLGVLQGVAIASSIFDLPVVIVSGDRWDGVDPRGRVDGTVFLAEDIRLNHPVLLDDLLRTRPEFGTWRNLSGAIAHPTSQGMQLRQLGTNASSRALLLMDGIPINDAFGGWIHWARFQLNAIDRIEVRPAGSTSNWGNFSAGGAVWVQSKSGFDASPVLDLEASEPRAYRAALFHPMHLGDSVALSFALQNYDNDGFYTLRAEDRGTVDELAGVSSQSYRARLEWRSARHWKGFVSADVHRESRRNGTALNRNQTEIWQLAAGLTRGLANEDWIQVHGYLQDLSFENVFSSVAEGRNSEIPALQQWDVPARSLGLNALWHLQHSPLQSSQIGVETRWVEGAVNEYYRNLGQGFTRERHAGGEQSQISLFLDHERELSQRVSWDVQLRWDRHRFSEGVRNEFVLSTGDAERLQSYPDRNLRHWSGSSSLFVDLSSRQRIVGRVFQGYRIPTLNELYRPFRVRNDITESNALLDAERYAGWELSWQFERTPGSKLRLQIYQYQLHSMIANVVLTREAGPHPEYGFIPPGGSFSRRESIDRARSQGVQFELSHEFGAHWQGRLAYLLSDTQITRSAFPDLAGSRFAQSPKHGLHATLRWMPRPGFIASVSTELNSHRYESLGESNKLASVFRADVGVDYQLRPGWNLSLLVHNVLDRETQTGFSSGLVSIGQPRTLRLSLRTEF